MIKLREERLIRSIGVSNFTEEQLLRLELETGVLPSVNQIEMHPAFAQQHLREVDSRLDIATESWSPLRRGTSLSDPLFARLAAQLQVTVTQVVLRWHVQLGAIPIPATSTLEHQRTNLDVFSFSLSDDEMASIAAVDQQQLGGDPMIHEEF
jgi:2,5-diketo-D-gluconate reductase A